MPIAAHKVDFPIGGLLGGAVVRDLEPSDVLLEKSGLFEIPQEDVARVGLQVEQALFLGAVDVENWNHIALMAIAG